MPRVFWNPYFQKGAGLARHAEPQAGNFQPIELMKSVSGGQTLCRQPCARTLCRQPCAGEPCAGLPCANPAGRGTRWHKVGLFRGQPYIYILDSHMAPYGACEVIQSTVRSSEAVSKEKYVRQNQAQSICIFEGSAERSRVEQCFRRLKQATCCIYCVFEGSTEQSAVYVCF